MATWQSSVGGCAKLVRRNVWGIRYGEMGALATKGGDLVRTTGNFYRAICEVQEPLFRTLQAKLDFILDHSQLFPSIAPGMIEVLTNGAVGRYQCDNSLPPHTRGLPYRANDPQNTELILSKLRADIKAKRFFLCTTGDVGLSEFLETTLPQGRKRKSGPIHNPRPNDDCRHEAH